MLTSHLSKSSGLNSDPKLNSQNVGQTGRIYRSTYGERHPRSATILDQLGVVVWGAGDLAAAGKYFEESLSIRRETALYTAVHFG